MVWCVADDYTLGRVDQKDEGVPRPVKALTEPVVQMSAGASHSAVLTAGGDVYTWGTYKDSNGHIGFKLQGKDLVFKQQLPEKMEQVAGKGVHQIASGSDFTLALTRDGLLYGWGDAENGNIGGPIPKSKPEKRKRLIPNGPIRLVRQRASTVFNCYPFYLSGFAMKNNRATGLR
jgi:alpha-tubulin suppressor-like RCC1 family protein